MRVAFIPLVALFVYFAQAAIWADDRAELLDGVTEFPTTGVPGGVSAISQDSFAVIVGRDGKSASSPVVAASSWDKGRVVALGHNGYLGLTNEPSVARLLTNAVRWTARDIASVKVGVRANNALVEHLAGQGMEAVTLEGIDWLHRIGDLRAICIDAHNIRGEKEVTALQQFVRGGGGLVIAATGWGWVQGNSGKLLASDFPGNHVILPAGLAFNGRMPERTANNGYRIEQADFTLLNASKALEALTQQESADTTLDKAQMAQAGATVSLALQTLSIDDQTFIPKVAALAKQSGGYTFPTPKAPLGEDHPVARLLTAFNVEQLRRAQPEKIRPHPAAMEFPGLVAGNAPAENREVTIDTAVPGWHSTGLYAAPGALIRAQISPDQNIKGFWIRIGCHTDSLWHHDEWRRVPEITVSTSAQSPETLIANAFGGLVYVEVPEKTDGFALKLTINGAVGAPYYVLGKTSVADWQKQRAKPAPWAELECGRVILTLPSEHVRQLQDPEALAKLWDRVVELEDQLAASEPSRKRPERIVADVQISAGYMHSGYPIMTHLDVAPQIVNLAAMQAGSWGHFHELGHNHQSSDWTFEGTGEVTCNIFSLYVMEKLCGKPPGQGHESMEPARVARRLLRHLQGEPSKKWERWQDDPFLALTLYHQLRVGFGWETYQKVFSEYRDLKRPARPKNDQDKRDQWMIRFSLAAGRNLGPFFDAWGIPISPDAAEQVKDLPTWMPADWPKFESQ